MAETFVQLPDDSANTGKKEDHFSVTGGNLREAVVVGDPISNTAVASVTSANGLQVDVTRVQGNVASTVADGANTVEGVTTDAAVTGDNSGTLSAKLRGLTKIFADVWDSGNHWLKVSIQNVTAILVSTKTALTVSAPTAASVGVTDGTALAGNANRKGLVLVNTSANLISVAFGTAAVLGSGITLNPNGGAFVMDEYTFNVGAVHAIAASGSSNLAIQEFTT